MTVFRAHSLKPAPVVAHEISKPAVIRVPGMLDEGGKARRNLFGQVTFAKASEPRCKNQSARIVIDAIAVRAIRHRVNGMLQQAGAVAHGQEMSERYLRHGISCTPESFLLDA